MEHERGWRLVYSGDTRPCAQMVELARGATLLIHEATFDEDMQEKAIGDRHSTVREALSVARDAQPKCTVLTHFSGRFEKTLPDVWEAQRAIATTAAPPPLEEEPLIRVYFPIDQTPAGTRYLIARAASDRLNGLRPSPKKSEVSTQNYRSSMCTQWTSG